MESFGLDVNYKSKLLHHVKQKSISPDHYILLLKMKIGLPYIDISPPTNEELENLPHIIMTSDDHWDPTILDNDFDSEAFHDVSEIPDDYGDDSFN